MPAGLTETFTLEEASAPESFSFDEATKPKGFSFEEAQAAPVQAPDLSKIKLSAYDQATVDRGGIKPPSGMESGTEFTTALAGGAARALAAVPPTIRSIADFPTTVARGISMGQGHYADMPSVGEERAAQAEGFGAAMQKPIVSLDLLKAKPEPDDPAWAAAIKEAESMLVSIPEFIESPLGILTMGTGAGGKAATNLARYAFAADMVKSLFEQAPQLRDNWGQMTPSYKGKAITQFLGTGAMAGLLMHPEARGTVKDPLANVADRTGQLAPDPIRLSPGGRPVFGAEAKPLPSELLTAPADAMATQPTPQLTPPAGSPDMGETLSGQNAMRPTASARAPEPPVVSPKAETPVTNFAKTLLDPKSTVEGGNGIGLKVGMAINSVEDLNALADLRMTLIKQGREAMKSGDINTASVLLPRAQFAREALETAINAGSHIEGKGSRPEKLGDRPLDWSKNPEVADWLKKNGEALGIVVPDELKAAAPTAPPAVSISSPSNEGAKMDKPAEPVIRESLTTPPPAASPAETGVKASSSKELYDDWQMWVDNVRSIEAKGGDESQLNYARKMEQKAHSAWDKAASSPTSESTITKQPEDSGRLFAKPETISKNGWVYVVRNADGSINSGKSGKLFKRKGGQYYVGGEDNIKAKSLVNFKFGKGEYLTDDEFAKQTTPPAAAPSPFKAGDVVDHQGQTKTIKRMSPDGKFAVIGNRAIPVREIKPAAQSAPELMTPGEAAEKLHKSDSPISARDVHKFTIQKAFEARKPVNASAADVYGLKPPSGYVLEGDRYVPKPAAPEKGMPSGQQGGGAAELGEVASGANEDIMGVRQVTREKQSAAGQPVVSEPNKGVNLEDSLADGRAHLAQDPTAADRAAADLENGRVSASGFNATRAKYEQVMAEGRRIAEKHGTDSPEYASARKEAFKWSDITKRMQTEWHKLGQGQQGETDIDTGELLDLENDYHSKSGKDMTPGQRKQGTRIAKVNKAAQDATGNAQEKFNRHIQDKATAGAEQRALDAANKTVRENAVRLADAENKARVAAESLKQATDKIQADAAARAAKAGRNTVMDADVRAAQAENKTRVDAAKRAVETAEVQRKAAQKAEDAANKTAREAAAARAAKERKLQGDPTLRVWTKAKEYLDAGLDNFDDIRKKLATDLGMSIEQITRLMAQDKRAKYLADDLWRKQQQERSLKSQAKRWVDNLSTPGLTKALQSIPRGMFVLKVGLHGTVALGTHAPTVAFQPRFWGAYVRNFAKMYHMVGSRAYYESQVQNLLRADNYTTARRAGLVNDPFVYEEYAMNPVVGGVARIAPKLATAINNMTGMGNRGYSVLKMLRQDMFDQHWNQLPKSMQIPEIAQAIADGVNHATGVVQGRAPAGTSLALFAPRLEASRVMWLAGDPGKAVGTLINWKNASQGEKYFAMNQLKEKAWVVGTFGSLLALNQGILSAAGSDQKVNVSDPFKPDFLKFKAAGMNVSYGNPMITMARLPLRLFVGVANEGKFNKIVYEDENVATILFEYVRSQMSPFAGTTTDLAIGRDFMRKPLPRAAFGLLPGKTNIPKRLKEQGVQPYTWKEYAVQQAAMIPLQEAIKEVWGKDLMMTPEARKHSLDALATIIVMSGTGARMSEDYSLKQKPAAAQPPWEQFSPR